MSLLLQRARRVAWKFTDSSKNDTASYDSGYVEVKEPRSLSPQPVQRLGKSAGIEKFVETLKTDGCVVVRDFTDLATLAQANGELAPYLDQQRKEDSELDGKALLMHRNSPTQTLTKAGGWGRTQTVTQLMQRSPTVRENFFVDELYQTLCELFLSTETVTWNGNSMTTSVSHPLLSSAITFDMPAGTPAQELHRDDHYYHARHNSVDDYEMGRDMLLALFVPGTNITEDVATRVVLGSHLWGDEKPPLGPDDDTPVTEVLLQKGEALIMLGSLYYGRASSGTSWDNIGKSQLMHAMFSCSGVYRQEENPFLTYSNEEVKTYSDLVKQRLGWKQMEPSLGWVDLKSPEFLLTKV